MRSQAVRGVAWERPALWLALSGSVEEGISLEEGRTVCAAIVEEDVRM
jgi:hypothetical protein